MDEGPQIYLITPDRISLSSFADDLARVLDAAPVACLRLALAETDVDAIGRAADAARAVAHDRDVAVVIADHYRLVERHGLDGVHLSDPRALRDVRKALGPDLIAGVHCGASRHDGMTAGEIGATYVSFGPVADTGLGMGEVASRELFQWWTEMIELPVVAEGQVTPDLARDLAGVIDFLALGPEVWGSDDPAKALTSYADML